jgi:hypothetical protein
MKTMGIRRPSAAFAGLLALTFGAVLWMIAERPEWRPAEGEDAVATGRLIASVGQGSAAAGSVALAYRAARTLGERGGEDRRGGEGARQLERRADVEERQR